MLSRPLADHEREIRAFPPPPQRLASLDIYRGFIMLCMVSGGLGFTQVVRNMIAQGIEPTRLWLELARQTDHAAWEGGVFWDFIQPAFMFMVGVSMAFSNANRRARGQSYARLFGHAVIRAIFLIALGIFLRSGGSEQTRFTFEDVVTQIGLGYVFLFLLWGHNFTTQLVVALAILVSYWCFIFFHPLPENFSYAEYKLPEGWVILDGLREPWNIHRNAAASFDRWFLNLLPPEGWYTFNRGGYQTLNFVPALATMIFGLMAGQWLRGDRSMARILGGLFIAGAIGIALGYVLHITGACPVIKKIWTPSWAIYCAGWASVMLGIFYFLFDMNNLRGLAWPVAAVGKNSLVTYILSWLVAGWLKQSVKIHLGKTLFLWLANHSLLPPELAEHWRESPPENVFALFGIYQPIAEQAFVVAVLWAIAIWMDRRKLYIRI